MPDSMIDALRYLQTQDKAIASVYAGAWRRHTRGEPVQPIELLAIEIKQAAELRDMARLAELATAWKAVRR